jgi:hypothetical protein
MIIKKIVLALLLIVPWSIITIAQTVTDRLIKLQDLKYLRNMESN